MQPGANKGTQRKCIATEVQIKVRSVKLHCNRRQRQKVQLCIFQLRFHIPRLCLPALRCDEGCLSFRLRLRYTKLHKRKHSQHRVSESAKSATCFFWLRKGINTCLRMCVHGERHIPYVQRKLCVHTILYDYILYVYLCIPEAE